MRFLYPAGRRLPAIWTNCRGEVSKRHGTGGRKTRRANRLAASVSMFPPIERRYDARAFAICWDPPFGSGQPPACPEAAITRPIADVPGFSKGAMECAAIPAKRPCARCPLNIARAKLAAGRSALKPKRAIAKGADGR